MCAMSLRHLRTHPLESDSIPWLQYVVGVGGALICLLFVADAWLPKAAPRPYREIDKTVLRVNTPLAQAGLGLTSLAQADAQRGQ